MADEGRVVVIGGGLFGITTAVVLARRGYQVTLLEKQSDLMSQASLVNQNRIHLGYHYPRSVATARESLDGLGAFREVYGAAVVGDIAKYYAISRHDSLTSPDDFVAFCLQVGLPLEEEWPSEVHLRRDRVAACWRVPETTFDYHKLRQIALGDLHRFPSISVVRNCTAAGIDVGPPHSIRLSDATTMECDVIVNTSYAGLGQVEALLGLTPSAYQYELCVMPLVEWDGEPARVGVTIMDGPFCSLMPKGRERGRYILYDVVRSVVQRRIAESCPMWEPIRGLVEVDMIDKCAEWFPVLRGMHYRGSWITTRVVVPFHDDDDARPTTITDHGSMVYSVFSGKLTTCVQAARDVLARLCENERAWVR